jgi:hypothetical protein
VTFVTVSDRFHEERIFVVMDNLFPGIVDRVFGRGLYPFRRPIECTCQIFWVCEQIWRWREKHTAPVKENSGGVLGLIAHIFMSEESDNKPQERVPV